MTSLSSNVMALWRGGRFAGEIGGCSGAYTLCRLQIPRLPTLPTNVVGRLCRGFDISTRNTLLLVYARDIMAETSKMKKIFAIDKQDI
jgi:hypothetical protein